MIFTLFKIFITICVIIGVIYLPIVLIGVIYTYINVKLPRVLEKFKLTFLKFFKSITGMKCDTKNPTFTPSYIIEENSYDKNGCLVQYYTVNIPITLDNMNVTVDKIVLYNHANFTNLRIYINGISSKILRLDYTSSIDIIYTKLKECNTFADIEKIK